MHRHSWIYVLGTKDIVMRGNELLILIGWLRIRPRKNSPTPWSTKYAITLNLGRVLAWRDPRIGKGDFKIFEFASALLLDKELLLAWMSKLPSAAHDLNPIPEMFALRNLTNECFNHLARDGINYTSKPNLGNITRVRNSCLMYLMTSSKINENSNPTPLEEGGIV